MTPDQEAILALTKRVRELEAERDAIREQFRKVLAVDASPDSTMVQFAETIAQMVNDLADAHQDAGKMWGLRLRERDEARAEVARLTPLVADGGGTLDRVRAAVEPLRELHAKAMQGEWKMCSCGKCGLIWDKAGDVVVMTAETTMDQMQDIPRELANANGALVVGLRNALPGLLAALEASAKFEPFKVPPAERCAHGKLPGEGCAYCLAFPQQAPAGQAGGKQKCSYCGGSGRRLLAHGIRDSQTWYRCDDCNGTGRELLAGEQLRSEHEPPPDERADPDCNCNPLENTGGGHRGDCPAYEVECTCYEMTGGHQPMCPYGAMLNKKKAAERAGASADPLSVRCTGCGAKSGEPCEYDCPSGLGGSAGR